MHLIMPRSLIGTHLPPYCKVKVMESDRVTGKVMLG